MHGSLPPLEITDPSQPHAFDGIPVQRKPDFADHECPTCLGRGAWNELFYTDSFRARLKDCPTCDGFGWVTKDGHHVALDIQVINGVPTWIIRDLPLAPENG